MKKRVAALCVLLASVSLAKADQYLQASLPQCPGTAAEVVKIDVTDAADGITMTDSKITVSEAGPYLIVAVPQVGREGGGPLGCFDL